MSNASSSFTEPYAAWRSDRPKSGSDNSPTDINSPVSFQQSAIHQPAINQSPEQHFEMSLLPGHTQPIYSPLATGRLSPAPAKPFVAKPFAAQPKTAQSSNISASSADVTALQQQQAAMCEQLQQQERITAERLKGLRHQLDRQAQRHQTEILRLNNGWKRQLADLDSAQTDSGYARHAQRPAQYKSSYQKSPLQGVSTTYQVPTRSQTRWVDKSLGAIPAFIWLVVLGIGIAAASAIALSPTVLWPSLSFYIRAAIPFIFVTGLLGLGITAVWDTSR